jgi:hypothetical protein
MQTGSRGFAAWLLGLFFGFKDVDHTFLQHVGKLLPDCTASYSTNTALQKIRLRQNPYATRILFYLFANPIKALQYLKAVRHTSQIHCFTYRREKLG